ncbi:6-hydroxy-D-nicotine oxidase [Mycobacterium talmoniae]|uniref:6-hydroxy-D-nicotine oxidase n=1 Tax=Mycobacterium talmoniae TaxID=1858794 RepID=A0A2S8BCK9_9MYCO|nr:6-hydroxy-D-nicotine oxidase [Mycobacterium talmoniae]
MLGPGCESVLGVDVVTADGQQRYCDPDTHADLYWAARGAGPGFFAVVTAFHLRLHPRPAVCGRGIYSYPVDAADEVFRWTREISPRVDARVELQLIAKRPAPGHPGPSIVVAAPVFADSEAEAQAALAILGSCPAIDQAIDRIPYAPTSLAEWYATASADYPRGHRYAVDNMWTSASAEELLPGLRRILDTMPPPPSHLLMYNWGRRAARRGLFYGLEDEINLRDLGRPRRRWALPRLGGNPDGRDGASGQRHQPVRREPGSAPGPVRHRRKHGPAAAGARRLRPRWPLPPLAGKLG